MRAFQLMTVLSCSVFSLWGLRVGADEQSIAERVNRLAMPYIENEIVVGMTIGVLLDGKSQAIGYGRTSTDAEQRPDGENIYEIGSTSKVFTGILLGDAVARKEVTLDQPVTDLLPEGVRMPIKGERPIRLRHLATHTSGLPRLPDNLQPVDGSNPYADYTFEQLYEFLGKHSLRREPEIEGEYSNLGMGLLGHALARQAGMDYEQLLAKRICEPLEMQSTSIELTPAARKRLASPYYADHSPAANWEIPALAGAGAIRSSGNDMLKFLAAQLDPPAGTLGEGIDLAWKSHWEPKAEQSFSVGLGWHIARDGNTRWHNGQTGGYHAMMLVNRPGKAGVVVLANTSTGEIDRLAEDILVMLLGGTVEPRSFPKRKELAVAPETMKRYVGRYQLAPNFHLTVTVKDKKLLVQATGQPAFQVFAKSETQWFFKVVEARITFKVDEAGRCNELVLHQAGRSLPARRVADEKTND